LQILLYQGYIFSRGLEARKNYYSQRGLIKIDFGGLYIRGRLLIGGREK
jgi:hypothetical protein